MSRNLGARNPIRTVFRVTFVENNAMFTIFLVLMGLLLNVVHADKEPHQNDAIVARVTEIPNHLNHAGPAMDAIEADSGKITGIKGEENKTETSSYLPDLGFWHAFLASISVILVSELGDKTFFIAAIMAMRHPRVTIFLGAISALALMTVLSAVFGMAATIIPRVYTYYISTALFAIFGLKMLKEGYYMSPNEGQEEFEEVQSDLRKREDELLRRTQERERGSGGRRASKTSVSIETDALVDDAVTVNSDGVQQISVQQPPPTATATTTTTHNNNNNTITKSLQSLHHHPDINGHVLNGSVKSLALPNASAGPDAIELRPLSSHSRSISTPSQMMSAQASSSNNSLQNRFEKDTTSTLISQDPETGIIRKSKAPVGSMLGRILMQAFTMTFLAEWGDRSQLTTILLAAREDVFGVIVGGVLGHAVCTGLAVIGGRMIAQRISVRTVTLIGGVVFLIFAFSALFFDPNDEKPMST